ncbi:MAG: UvrB/UvrC motif-containing protein, partial [bacterium]
LECSGCGLTWDQFEKTGLVGCDSCYQVFSDDLNLILRRIHGSNQHIGSRPKSQRYRIDKSELKKIRLELQAAIENEDFELAAELRDMVRDAESGKVRKKEDGILR